MNQIKECTIFFFNFSYIPKYQNHLISRNLQRYIRFTRLFINYLSLRFEIPTELEQESIIRTQYAYAIYIGVARKETKKKKKNRDQKYNVRNAFLASHLLLRHGSIT